MKIIKANKITVVALALLLAFVAVSWYRNSIFLDKILISSFILGEILLMKILGSFKRIESRNDHQSENASF